MTFRFLKTLIGTIKWGGVLDVIAVITCSQCAFSNRRAKCVLVVISVLAALIMMQRYGSSYLLCFMYCEMIMVGNDLVSIKVTSAEI